ncbi:GNAT family N-acetyltransferase, partial [Arthrospira platensis SPKY2]
GDEPVAALVGFLGGNEFFAVKIAYSERWAKASPGHLLIERVLETCCDRAEIELLNLGWEAGWSSSWRPEEIELSTIYAGLGGWRGRAALALLAFQPRKARIQLRHS